MEDERSLELETISAIYPELRLGPDFTAALELPITPVTPVPVLFPLLSSGDGTSLPSLLRSTDDEIKEKISASVPNSEVRKISHFPPITLHISLPHDYPSQSPPKISVDLETAWIPEQKIKELEDAATALWEESGRDATIYIYIDYVQQAAEELFYLLPVGTNALVLPGELEIALLDYNLKAERLKFEQETFECGVCLEPKKGSKCHRLVQCGHVFCVLCLQDFYSNCITEGDVISVKCLTPDCGKEEKRKDNSKKRRRQDMTLEPSELLQIPLEQDVVQRYVKLKRKKQLESNKYTIYCPRQWCQGPARTKERDLDESDSEDNNSEVKEWDPNGPQSAFPPPSERLVVCSDCSFAFCCVCKTGWHGEFANCFPRRQYELTAEEQASEAYLKKHSTPCPTCDAKCQKTMGCNHMICFRCQTHFCYLCSSWLDESNPYAHFNTTDTPCYQLLWELEGGDEEGIEPVARFAPVAAPPPPAVARAPDAPVNIVFEHDDVPPPAPVPPQAPAPAQIPLHANNRGRNRLMHQQAANANPRNGLQRFLAMAANDEEDEWDSDELEDWSGESEDEWEAPEPPRQNRRRR